jgi:hypothetical protein
VILMERTPREGGATLASGVPLSDAGVQRPGGTLRGG